MHGAWLVVKDGPRLGTIEDDPLFGVPIAPPRVDSSKGPPREIGKSLTFFAFFRPTQKIAWDGPKWGRDVFFPTNPDLADILGDTDFDFKIFVFFFESWICISLDFQIPDSQIQGCHRVIFGRGGSL